MFKATYFFQPLPCSKVTSYCATIFPNVFPNVVLNVFPTLSKRLSKRLFKSPHPGEPSFPYINPQIFLFSLLFFLTLTHCLNPILLHSPHLDSFTHDSKKGTADVEEEPAKRRRNPQFVIFCPTTCRASENTIKMQRAAKDLTAGEPITTTTIQSLPQRHERFPVPG